MSEEFEESITKYIKSQLEVYKKYLLTALENKNLTISFLDESLGTPVPSMDIRNCEVLTDAQLFKEEIKLTRDGRNRYKHFCLTELGKEIAQKIKQEESQLKL